MNDKQLTPEGSKRTPGQWGIEKSERYLWIGPLNTDGKVESIVTHMEIDPDYKPAVIQRRLADAELLASAPALQARVVELENALDQIVAFEREPQEKGWKEAFNRCWMLAYNVMKTKKLGDGK